MTEEQKQKYIDTMKEKPVSIWHDASKKPERDDLLIETNDGRIIHRQSVNNYGMVKRWAYCKDILNLSNVERTGKNWKEEPKKCMYTKDDFTEEDRKILCEDCEEECVVNKYLYGKEPELVDIDNIPLDPYIQYASREQGIKAHAETYSFNIESELFQQLTKEQQELWRKEIEQACISGGYCGLGLASDKRYDKEEPVSEDLNDEIRKYFLSYKGYPHVMDEMEKEIKKAIIYFANWQKEQDQSTIELAEDHAMLAGMEKMKEEMIEKAVDGKVVARYPKALPSLYEAINVYIENDTKSLKEGDNVKVIVIKED